MRRIRQDMAGAMLLDQAALAKGLKSLLASLKKGHVPEEEVDRQFGRLEKRLSASVFECERRRRELPRLDFPENLPITSRKDDLIRAIQGHRVVIVAGETGSGKSTQLPKMCLAAGRGIAGRVGCTQPRRIAAATIARRVAEELGEELGRSVGYKVRFKDRTDPRAYIKVVTDGMLLAETQGDRHLFEYDTLIIDEAHERSLNIDFLLGILRNLLEVRPELKVIVTSATLDTAKFSAFFGDAPVIEVSGRMYPVEVVYRPLDPERESEGDLTYVDLAVEAVDSLRKARLPGDVLIFMPTEQDILETCERLEGRHFPGVTVLRLFARLPASEQGRVYAVSGPKIVVATNVAETSLTIPGIRYVIDTGLARISRYVPRTRTTSLPISPISISSADQRKGRCGRVQNGVCIRLYSEEDYASRAPFTPPEVLRSNLAEVILRMIALGLGDIAAFPFVDRPNPRSVKDGFDLLEELGAIRRRGRKVLLTEKGRLMARMPLDPKIARMMLEAVHEGCVDETAVIAAALSVQDPRERPLDKAAQADQMHAPFKDPDSDFVTLLNIWNRYHGHWAGLKTQNQMRRFCRTQFLSFPRMREWMYIHEQIVSILNERRLKGPAEPAAAGLDPLYDRLHRAVLSGFLSNIALRKEKNLYQAARGREVMVHPGSSLFNKGRPWIVAAEIVKTSRLFARTVARIDPGWLEALGGDLCRRSYAEPHWEKSRGEVRAYEQVTLYGLPIVARRPVSYGPIRPEEAHRIFVQSGLVEGSIREPLGFLKHNRALMEAIGAMEEKIRRRGLMVNEEAVAEFYSSRLAGMCDVRTLKRVIRERAGDAFLRMREEDLVQELPDRAELERYPDRMVLGNKIFSCSYRFSPGAEEDGVTIRIPAGALSEVPAERLEWGVPGLYREKIAALIKGLPKRYRKQLVPASATVDIIVAEMEQGSRPLISSLARFVYERFGVEIPAAEWAAVELPEYLKMRVAVVDEQGKELEAGRDIHLLEYPGGTAAHAVNTLPQWKDAQAQWEEEDVRDWTVGELPERIPLDDCLDAYPALAADDGGRVNLRLFPDRDQAAAVHREGIKRLLELRLAKDLKYLKRSVSLAKEASPGAVYFGGARRVEEQIYEAVLEGSLALDLRSREAFDRHAAVLREGIFEEAAVLREQAEKVLKSFEETRGALYDLERANATNEEVLALCAGLRRELDALLPPDFIRRYAPDQLSNMPRYLKAIQLRVERGAYDPAKDRRKQADVDPFVEALQTMTGALSPRTSREKREALEAFRWMVEEFKVSLFAQELKTPYPVSPKRLEEKRKELERMI
ncbi:ATP-dependent RNA helicase HrpA [Desulfatiglans anilini]|uniref:ATP-dependent RNA helicase HrpA n=1 Tax=Desulfatiglans anilini TaxID=90728 RepID=UPI000412D58A|nr:ATP-dependent RNA helicase HrpA [Desulfatiglans anilini]